MDDGILFFLYIGFVGAAFAFNSRTAKATFASLQFYVAWVLGGTLILLFVFFTEYVQDQPYNYVNIKIAIASWLVIPLTCFGIMILLWQFVTLQRESGKLKWFTIAQMSMISLIWSPLLARLLTYEGGTQFINMITSISLYSWIYVATPFLFFLMLVFLPGLSHQAIPTIKRYTLLIVVLASIGIYLHYLKVLEQGESAQTELLSTILASLIPGTLGGLTLYSIVRLQRERFLTSLLAVVSSLVLVWSPYLGSVTIFESCNAIHQWQLAPVIDGLRRYKQDSARYPLGVQALVPYYVDTPPGLLCFGGSAYHYELHQCHDNLFLSLENSTSQLPLLYNFYYGVWSTPWASNFECR
jgi:hypothetical protein